ncbi:MAG: prepilin-type N-terminal cleavage/methylation domain-containing protein [Ruminiclostridium sp.]
MIKKLQKLKAKKGFTLVELIVVIAIIGVLAAILIPTMLGFVTSSRVTSANSTAASIKKQIDNFLTDADTAGYGMKQSASATANITFKVDGDGKWDTTITTGAYAPGAVDLSVAFKNDSKWGTTGIATDITKDSSKASAADAVELLTIDLASVFPDVKNSYIFAYCEGGKTLYVAYTADGDSTPSDLPTQDEFEQGVCEWDGNTAGITSDGITLGTAPALSLGTATVATP